MFQIPSGGPFQAPRQQLFSPMPTATTHGSGMFPSSLSMPGFGSITVTNQGYQLDRYQSNNPVTWHTPIVACPWDEEELQNVGVYELLFVRGDEKRMIDKKVYLYAKSLSALNYELLTNYRRYPDAKSVVDQWSYMGVVNMSRAISAGEKGNTTDLITVCTHRSTLCLNYWQCPGSCHKLWLVLKKVKRPAIMPAHVVSYKTSFGREDSVGKRMRVLSEGVADIKVKDDDGCFFRWEPAITLRGKPKVEAPDISLLGKDAVIYAGTSGPIYAPSLVAANSYDTIRPLTRPIRKNEWLPGGQDQRQTTVPLMYVFV